MAVVERFVDLTAEHQPVNVDNRLPLLVVTGAGAWDLEGTEIKSTD